MDDSQTLDDLAALFLSPPGGDAAPEPLSGPAPVRLRPKPAAPRPAPAAPAPAPGVATAGPLPGVAGVSGVPGGGGGPRLRLADARPPARPPATAPPAFPGVLGVPRSPVAPAVEAVVLGNLPGLADAWLPQYAQLLALRDGPVLLLHPVGPTDGADPLGGGAQGPGFELEWIGPGGPEAASLLAALPEEAPLLERVSALVTRAARPPSTLLVHATAEEPSGGGGVSGVSGGGDAARFAGVRDWALLSGDDPVAIQAAAAAVRRLVAAAGSLSSASVGLVVMGAGPADAEPAAAALDEAVGGAAGPLEHPVEPLGALPRMNPVTRTPLGFAPDPADDAGPDAGGWPSLLPWLRSLPPETPQTPQTSEAPETPESSEPAARPEPAGPGAPAGGPTGFGWTVPPLDDEPPGAPAAPGATPGPAPGRRDLTPAPGPGPAPGLRLVGGVAPGAALAARLAEALPAGPRLDPIGPGCPDQPGVQLALDAAGRLHLIARHTHSPEHPHPREAMLALRDATDWAREHQHWLAAAHPHRRVDATEPVPHLLTDRPDLGFSLAKKLGPALRLYLLHGDVCYALTEAP